MLVALWRVNDTASGSLMHLFYRNVAAGMTLPEALRQLGVENDGKKSISRFW